VWWLYVSPSWHRTVKTKYTHLKCWLRDGDSFNFSVGGRFAFYLTPCLLSTSSHQRK
jgi:hypothetical protein